MSTSAASNFEQLKAELPAIQVIAKGSGAIGFFAQEVLRFHSIAGTLLGAAGFSLDELATNDERYLTHILSRSMLENYFWIIYLFDDPAQTSARYDQLQNSFKRDYFKLLNEPQLPFKTQLEPSNALWQNLPRSLDVNSMLSQVKNDYGDRLNYLYFAYRIASFDTHGKSLEAIFTDAFQKQCNFPVLKIRYSFELIANGYLIVLRELRAQGLV
jgi:hypothetical protein